MTSTGSGDHTDPGDNDEVSEVLTSLTETSKSQSGRRNTRSAVKKQQEVAGTPPLTPKNASPQADATTRIERLFDEITTDIGLGGAKNAALKAVQNVFSPAKPNSPAKALQDSLKRSHRTMKEEKASDDDDDDDMPASPSKKSKKVKETERNKAQKQHRKTLKVEGSDKTKEGDDAEDPLGDYDEYKQLQRQKAEKNESFSFAEYQEYKEFQAQMKKKA